MLPSAMAAIEQVPSYAGLEYDTPLYRTAIAQFDEAVPHADVDPGIAERLRHPERSFIVACPIGLDDGSRTVFPGYRVQHSSILGPTKGGIRYDEDVTLGECAALAMWMEPLAPNRTLVHRRLYVHPESDPESVASTIAAHGLVHLQDVEICSQVQRSHDAGVDADGVLATVEERGVFFVHQQLRRALADQ